MSACVRWLNNERPGKKREREEGKKSRGIVEHAWLDQFYIFTEVFKGWRKLYATLLVFEIVPRSSNFSNGRWTDLAVANLSWLRTNRSITPTSSSFIGNLLSNGKQTESSANFPFINIFFFFFFFVKSTKQRVSTVIVSTTGNRVLTLHRLKVNFVENGVANVRSFRFVVSKARLWIWRRNESLDIVA